MSDLVANINAGNLKTLELRGLGRVTNIEHLSVLTSLNSLQLCFHDYYMESDEEYEFVSALMGGLWHIMPSHLSQLRVLALHNKTISEPELRGLRQLSCLVDLLVWAVHKDVGPWHQGMLAELPQLTTLQVLGYAAPELAGMHRLLHTAPNLAQYLRSGGAVFKFCNPIGDDEYMSIAGMVREVCSRLVQLRDKATQHMVEGMSQQWLSFDFSFATSRNQMVDQVIAALRPLNEMAKPLYLEACGNWRGVRALHSSTVQALATALPNLAGLLWVRYKTDSLQALAAMVQMQHLKHLYLPTLPQPTKDSIHLLEHLGHQLTYLSFTMTTSSLGLLPWLNKSRPPTFPALQKLSVTSYSYGLSLADKHYLMHAAPNTDWLDGAEECGINVDTCPMLDELVTQSPLQTLAEIVGKIASSMHLLHLHGKHAPLIHLAFPNPELALQAPLYIQQLQALPVRRLWISRQPKTPLTQGGRITLPNSALFEFTAAMADAVVAHLPELTYLHLSECKISQFEALLGLFNSKNVVGDKPLHLTLMWCDGLTPEDVLALCALAPKAYVEVLRCSWWTESAEQRLRAIRMARRRHAHVGHAWMLPC